MTALVAEFGLSQRPLFRYAFPLATGQKAWKGGTACGDTATHTCKKGATGNTNLLVLGTFNETIDNTAGGAAVPVEVNFIREVRAVWRANDGTITKAANLFGPAYVLDDQTVTANAANNSKFGTILDVDASLGVLVALEPV